MDHRIRRSDEVLRSAPGEAAEGTGGGNLPELRRQAEQLLSAGDEAIQRALSGDSERFLRANRQQGGQ